MMTAFILILSGARHHCSAQTPWSVVIDDVRLHRQNDGRLLLQLRYCPVGVALPSGHIAVIAPRMVNGADTLSFPAVRIYGNWARYHAIRYGRPDSPGTDQQLRSSDVLTYTSYCQTVGWQPWFDQASLLVTIAHQDDCGRLVSNEERTLLVPTERYNYRETEGLHDERTDHLQGTAYITFPSNKTDIQPDLGRNRRELLRLRHTIDSIMRAPNVSVQRIVIKGFASPEGSYENNARLAKGRTESLSNYISAQWGIDPALVYTSYEPEDWEGLRLHVANGDWPEQQQLLDIIDSDSGADEKLALIMQRYPAAYKRMMADVFPLLRHTDYQVDYSLNTVTDIAGITETDTIRQLVVGEPVQMATDIPARFELFRPKLALKTNMLFDLAVAPNIAVELPMGRRGRWSIMAEYINPWWRWDRLSYSYQIQAGILELRRWLWPRCDGGRPWLSGHFIGIFGGGGKYDLENKDVGDQGELFGGGLTYGYSWPVARRWNLELSASAGVLAGERRHYNAEFESTHLIYRYTKNMFYVGPINLRFSLVWIIGKKGGDL